MTSNLESGSFDLAISDRKNDEESSWDVQTLELLASADRGTDQVEPFPLEPSGITSPYTPSFLQDFSWTSPSFPLSSSTALIRSRKKARSHNPVRSQTNTAAASDDDGDRSSQRLFEPLLIAEALLELDSVVRDATNVPIKKREVSCRCTKSKCLKLYCSCFSSGLACTPYCSCVDCKNTKDSGIANHAPNCNCVGCRSVKIETSLKLAQATPSQSQSCSCKSSRCLQLYCSCFQSGSFCSSLCRCIGCSNTSAENSENGARAAAISQCLRRRSDAFDARPKGKSDSCFCKTNR